MQELVLFFMTFIFVFILYQIFIIRPAKKRVKDKSKDRDKKELREIKFLINKYKLDIKKVNYNQLLQIVALVSSLDIALVVSVIMLFDNFFMEILVGFIFTLIIILVSYYLVYLFYKKKGMIVNE